MRITCSIFTACVIALLAQGCGLVAKDHSEIKYYDDVKMTSGIAGGNAFMQLENTGQKYCKVKIKNLNERSQFFFLVPGENSGIKNIAVEDNVKAICEMTIDVYNRTL